MKKPNTNDISTPRNLREYGCPLVGHYFHTFKPCVLGGKPSKRVEWQGQVISEITPAVYLCQLFEWMMGGESNRVLMTLDSLMACHFYETAEEMASVYEQTWSRVAQEADK